MENGEVRHGTLSESGQGLKIDTYAKIFSLTRQALINDDLVPSRTSSMHSRNRQPKTEGDLLFELLSANALAAQ